MNIPKQLCDNNFKFIKLKKKGKEPLEKWKEQNYSHKDKLLNYYIKQGFNYGVIGGEGGLLIVDCDSDILKNVCIDKLPTTFTVISGRGVGAHFYFYCEDGENFDLDIKDEHLGEVRAKDRYVVCPGSIHPNGKEYKVGVDFPIAKITMEELRKAFEGLFTERKALESPEMADFDAKKLNVSDLSEKLKVTKNNEKFNRVLNGDITGFKSNSEAEFYLVSVMKGHSFTFQEIDFVLMHNSKTTHWKNAPLSYKTKTYGKLQGDDLEHIENMSLKDDNENKKEKRKLELLSYEDLGNVEIKEKSYVLKPYIPENCISWLTGKSGTFKTTLACHIALSIASGKKAFENMEVKQRSVIFIDEENGIEEIKDRIYKISKNMSIEKLENIHFCSFNGFKFDDKDMYENLVEFIKDKEDVVVIVDSFRRTVSCEENDATEMNNLFTKIIRPFMKQYPSTFLFLHHHRKGNDKQNFSEPLDEIRGSSEIVNYADSIFMTKRSRQDNNISLIHAKARRSKPQDTIKIGIDYQEEQIVFDNMGKLDEQRDKTDECHVAIMTWVNENNIKESKTKDIVSAMSKVGFKQQMVSAVLKEMLEGGSNISNPKRGIWVFGSVQEDLTEFNRNEQSVKPVKGD